MPTPPDYPGVYRIQSESPGSTSLKEFSGGSVRLGGLVGMGGGLAQREKSPDLESPEVGISGVMQTNAL